MDRCISPGATADAWTKSCSSKLSSKFFPPYSSSTRVHNILHALLSAALLGCIAAIWAQRYERSDYFERYYITTVGSGVLLAFRDMQAAEQMSSTRAGDHQSWDSGVAFQQYEVVAL